MNPFQLIGPFLVGQAVLLDWLGSASSGAVLRPRRSDYAVFGTALGWIGVAMCGVTLLLAGEAGDLRTMAIGLVALAVAVGWAVRRRGRRSEPHADDLRHRPHEVLDTRSGETIQARLTQPGEVGGASWPAGSVLRFDRAGWLKEATPAVALSLGGFPLAAGQPVRFDEGGRIRELVAETDVVAGRLPRGPVETRGAELTARAGTAFDPIQLRGVVLAEDTRIRGVDVPAGSTVSAYHGVRVELATAADVFGERIDKGARLRFPQSAGVLSILRPRPAVRVSLAPEEGYRTGGERRTIALYRDGRVA